MNFTRFPGMSRRFISYLVLICLRRTLVYFPERSRRNKEEWQYTLTDIPYFYRTLKNTLRGIRDKYISSFSFLLVLLVILVRNAFCCFLSYFYLSLFPLFVLHHFLVLSFFNISFFLVFLVLPGNSFSWFFISLIDSLLPRTSLFVSVDPAWIPVSILLLLSLFFLPLWPTYTFIPFPQLLLLV